LVDTSVGGQQRPFCSDCEKEINQNIANMLKRKGKKIKNKSLYFPKPSVVS